MRAYMTSRITSCVVIRWLPNKQRTKCMLNVSNLCPHSHMRKLDANGWIKLKRKHNVEVKVECVMWNEQINGQTTNHSFTPLPKQKWMQVLKDKEMESSSKIDWRDVLWWMSIKGAYRFGALVIARLLKKGCISLVVGKGHLAFT